MTVEHFLKTLGFFFLLVTIPFWILPMGLVGIVIALWDSASYYAVGNHFRSYDD